MTRLIKRCVSLGGNLETRPSTTTKSRIHDLISGVTRLGWCRSVSANEKPARSYTGRLMNNKYPLRRKIVQNPIYVCVHTRSSIHGNWIVRVFLLLYTFSNEKYVSSLDRDTLNVPTLNTCFDEIPFFRRNLCR